MSEQKNGEKVVHVDDSLTKVELALNTTSDLARKASLDITLLSIAGDYGSDEKWQRIIDGFEKLKFDLSYLIASRRHRN